MSKLDENERNELEQLRYAAKLARAKEEEKRDTYNFFRFVTIGSIQWIIGGLVLGAIFSPILRQCSQRKYERMSEEALSKFR
jgi:hypothetical protein